MPTGAVTVRRDGYPRERESARRDDEFDLPEEAVLAGEVTYRWRGALTDAELVTLIAAHGGQGEPGWWDQVRPHSMGWMTARLGGSLIGFVNVAWDGGDHAFLLDTKVASARQRQGIATELVRHAVSHARAAGCEWLHVDFTADLAPFYLGACGFRPTAAGLVHLPSLPPAS